MRDTRLEELLSAYLDDGLSPDERLHVERALSESPDARQRLEQFQRQKDLLKSLPRHRVPERLADRILSRLNDLASQTNSMSAGGAAEDPILAEFATPAKHTTVRGLSQPRSGNRKVALGILATLAAGLLIAFVIRQTAVPVPVVRPGPDEPNQSLPNDQLASAGLEEFQRRFKYLAIYDVTVSPKGQEQRVLEQCLRTAEIPVDAPIPIENRLEQGILESRFIGQDRITVEGRVQDVSQDSVDMMFVRGKADQMDTIWRELLRRRQEDAELVYVRMDLAVATKELEIFLNLNNALDRAAPSRLANVERWSRPGAHRLQFRLPLRSITLTSLGAISPGSKSPPAILETPSGKALVPTSPRTTPPGEKARETSQDTPLVGTPQIANEPGNTPLALPANVDLRDMGVSGDQPSQILIIVRNLRQGL